MLPLRRLRDKRVRIHSSSSHHFDRLEKFRKRTHVGKTPLIDVMGDMFYRPGGLLSGISVKKIRRGGRDIYFGRISSLNIPHEEYHARMAILRDRVGIPAVQGSVLLVFEEAAYYVKPSGVWKKFGQIKTELRGRGQGELKGKVYHVLADSAQHFSSLQELHRALFEMYRSRRMRATLLELGQMEGTASANHLLYESEMPRLNKMMDKAIDFLAQKSVLYKKQGH